MDENEELLPHRIDSFEVEVPKRLLISPKCMQRSPHTSTAYEFSSDYEEWSSFTARCFIHKCTGGSTIALPAPLPELPHQISTREIRIIGSYSTAGSSQELATALRKLEQGTKLTLHKSVLVDNTASNKEQDIEQGQTNGEGATQSPVLGFSTIYTIRNSLAGDVGSNWFQMELEAKATSLLGLARWNPTESITSHRDHRYYHCRLIHACVIQHIQQVDNDFVAVDLKAFVLKLILPSQVLIDDYSACAAAPQMETNKRRAINAMLVDYSTGTASPDDITDPSLCLEELYLRCILTGETGSFRGSFTGAESPGRFLTAHNMRNMRHGYETYLPASLDEMESYWRLHFGYPIYSDTVTVDSIVLVELEMSFGPRIFPLPVLALHIGKSEHHTRMRREDILRNEFLPDLGKALKTTRPLVLTVRKGGGQITQAPELVLDEDHNSTPRVEKPADYVPKTGAVLKLQLVSARELRNREAMCPPPEPKPNSAGTPLNPLNRAKCASMSANPSAARFPNKDPQTAPVVGQSTSTAGPIVELPMASPRSSKQGKTDTATAVAPSRKRQKAAATCAPAKPVPAPPAVEAAVAVPQQPSIAGGNNISSQSSDDFFDDI